MRETTPSLTMFFCSKLISIVSVFFAAIFLLLIVVDEKVGIYSMAFLGAFVFFVLFIFSPILVSYAIVIVATLSLGFREISFTVGNTAMTLSGALWLSLLFSMFVRVLLQKRFSFPHFGIPFLFFLLWSVMRWLIEPTGMMGLKDIIWFATPLLTLIWTASVFEKGDLEKSSQLERTFLIAIPLSLALIIGALAMGKAEYTWRGPRGSYLGDSRTLAEYLLVLMSLALARMRYSHSKTQGSLAALVGLVTILSLLGRMSSLMAIILFVIGQLRSRDIMKMVLIALLVSIAVIFLVEISPVLEQKQFFQNNELVISAQNTAGRLILWKNTFYSAMESPIWGKGLGSARTLNANLVSDKKNVTEQTPLNEYLEIFHDLGLFGLFLFLFSWISTFFYYYNRWRKVKENELSKWNMASIFVMLALFGLAMTSHTFHFPSVLVPAGTILGIAFARNTQNVKTGGDFGKISR